METEEINDDDIRIIEEPSTSTHNFRSKPPPPTSSSKNQNFSEFPDDDFDFDDCDVIIKTKESQRFLIHASFFIPFLIYIYCICYLFFYHLSVNKAEILQRIKSKYARQ